MHYLSCHTCKRESQDNFCEVNFALIELMFLSFLVNEVRYSFQDTPKGHPGVGDAEYNFEQTKAGKGAVTSHYYRTFNIPERFDNPGMFHSLLQI